MVSPTGSRAIEYSRYRDVLYFVDAAWGLLFWVVVLAFGLSSKLYGWSGRLTQISFFRFLLYAALVFVLSTVVQLPLSYYSGFALEHEFGLSVESFAHWIGQEAKALALGIAIGAPLLFLFYRLLARSPRRWWIWGTAASIPLAVFFITVAPVVLDPIFHKFKPLSDAALTQDILAEAGRAGIQADRVFEVEMSKETKKLNAYVNGLFGSKRIVLWDTTLRRMQKDEILFVMGHEMGHYVLHHLWKGLALAIAMLGIGFFLAHVFSSGLIARFQSRFGFASLADPSSVPLLALILGAFLFLMSPVQNGFSRMIEHDADIYGLELTHTNDAAQRAFTILGEDNLSDPDPAAWIEFWRYSHPPIPKRVAFAKAYRPWESGMPMRSSER